MRIISSKTNRFSLLPSTFYLLPSAFFYLLPSVSLANDSIKIFDTPNKLTFTDLAGRLAGVGNTIITFLVGVALVLLIWGAFKYIRAAGDSEKLAEGRRVAVYGIIALFLMLSFWGFVMIIKKSLFG